MDLCIDRRSLLRDHKDLENAPICVLLEIASSLSIRIVGETKRSTILSKVQSLPLQMIPSTGGKEFASIISGTINRYEVWDPKNLQAAFDDYLEFSQSPFTDANGRQLGPKTNGNPRSVDSTMAYRMCLEAGITIHPDASERQLYVAVTLLSKGREFIKEIITGCVDHVPLGLLVDMAMSAKTDQSCPPMILETTPTPSPDIPSKAIKEFKINISSSSCPGREYARLTQSYPLIFIPVDGEYRSRYLRNPFFFSSNHRWFPKYYYCYSEKERRDLCVKMGISPNATLVEMEERSKRCPYLGPNPETTVTSVYHDIIDGGSPWDSYITFIDKDLSSHTLSVTELSEHFQTTNSLMSMFRGEAMSKQDVNALLAITSGSLRQQILDLKREEEKIVSIIANKSLLSGFIALFIAASYMRGWTGEGPVPITTEQSSSNDFPGIERRSIEALHKLATEHPELSDVPLILMDSSRTSFTPTHDTIGRRVKVVLTGVSESSCIRLSSTIFMVTAHYFIGRMTGTPPFDLMSLGLIT